ncbi:MAG: hypothetical protein ACK4NZ_13245, partial [Tsuneonella sp.]
MLTAEHARLAAAPHMVSLGDAVHRPRLLDSVFARPMKERLGLTGPLMLDSGGFTLLGRPGFIDLPRLIDIYGATDADYVVALDAPTLRGEKRAARSAKHAQTLGNLERLSDVIEPRRLVPVVHGPTLKEVETNADAVAALAPHARLVALGGIVPLLRSSGSGQGPTRRSSPLRHVARAIRTVRARFPDAIIHVLGAGSPTTLLGLVGIGADSVDSIGWRRAAGFGAIFIAGTGERFPMEHARERRSRPVLSAHDRDRLAQCICPPCLAAGDIEARVRLYNEKAHTPRAQHNAWTLLEEAAACRHARANGEEA